MLFTSRNEDGIPAWQLVLNGTKTVTRRMKPQPVGAIRAVQPGRGMRAVGYVRITKCYEHIVWIPGGCVTENWTEFVREAHREGFKTWGGLLAWFDDHKIDIRATQRIEFVMLEASPRAERGAGSVTLKGEVNL